MTIPGPKMYFQGDDELNLSYFKFFREFSNDKQKRAKDPNFIQNIINEKGYDTLESIARKDSLLDNIELQENNNRCIKSYTTFMRKILDSLRFNPVLTKGDIINTYKDHTNKIHIHHLKLNDDEALVIKNFGTKFFENFGYPNFPNGNWQESFNSDASWFKGSSYINVSRDITQQNQNLRLAPNSVVILKKV
jgi:1,4-alpha-glucan branching enzyme